MMKCFKMAILCTGFMLGLSGFQAQAAPQQKEAIYLQNYNSILRLMIKEMDAAEKTGDPSIDFLNEMIPHHEAAISMSENELKYGGDRKVKKLADQIITDQLKGVSQMKAMLKRLKANPTIDKEVEATYIRRYQSIAQEMFKRMKNVRATGNIDKDFLDGMIPHHEGAIEMAKNILQFTSDPELRKFAAGIIQNQGDQLQEMERMRVKLH
ncbi:DUF305 domain-containing protein [Bacillus sp. 1P06AnD]|uniref:DUF305 domain-containing protein n=1 Tax=Bacillus sp. 1P06AnD TaxID=3132208 RepID=UPI0039A284A9